MFVTTEVNIGLETTDFVQDKVSLNDEQLLYNTLSGKKIIFSYLAKANLRLSTVQVLV